MTADPGSTLGRCLDAIHGLDGQDWIGSVDDLTAELATAQDLARKARQIAEDITAALVAAMGTERRADTPTGIVEVRGGRKRSRWDSVELARRIAHRALVDLDTGELKASTLAEAADLVLTELVACAPMTPSMAWRVGALRDRDIDPDEWCESTPAPPSVQLTRGAA